MKSFKHQLLLRKHRALTAAVLAFSAVACIFQSTRVGAASAKLDQALAAYDAAITADTSATAVAKLTTPVTLDGTAGSAFDFGATSGDVTMEFIAQGDPTATGNSRFLAVGENTTSSLRFEQWQNTGRLGFTQGGVADYLFAPSIASPTNATHIAYVWSAADLTMRLFVNGVLAGTASNVSDAFAMPTGAGFLGANPTGAEAMVGSIYRVTVYPGALPETAIQSHANAFANVALPVITSFTSTPAEIEPQGSATLSWEVQNATAVFLNNAPVTGTNQTVSPAATAIYTLTASNEVAVTTSRVTVLVNPRLQPYDAAIAADTAAGLAPAASLTNTVTLIGTGGVPFDFGPNSGDVTMEFILEGDSEATGDSGYLAVGENTTSSLRYEQWQNTRQLGFTQGGVADYMFNPALPSPSIATHVTYVWNAATLSMKIYVNGVPSGVVNNVSDAFAMPTGAGFLGANAAGGEAMVGRIFRVVVYDEIVNDETIKRHADAFTSELRPPIIGTFTATPAEILGQGSSVLNWQVQNATALFLDGADVTGLTSRTVSPTRTTSYTLVASNSVSTVSNKVTVLVSPLLDKYDAAIAADRSAGLTPLATLTNAVTLTGTGGEPFDFGATSGDTTMEFILEGDPTGRPDGYLAVGENTTSNLRYAQWQNTQQMGFTQLGVADYLFDPAVPSPTSPTHVTYVWNTTDLSMNIYTNGVLAGVETDVSPDFAMPTGAGFLGATPAGGEAMVGRIFRIVVYSGVLPEATIQRHASAFMSAGGSGPSLGVTVTGGQPTLTLQGVAGTHYRVEYRDSLAATDTWQLLQDIASLSGTSVQVTDPTAATGRTQRFYRAVAVP